MPVSSDDVVLGRIAAGQRDIGVWLRRAPSAAARGRCHLLCHWAPGAPNRVVRDPTQYCSAVTMKAWLEGGIYTLQYLADNLPTGDIRVCREGEGFYLSSSKLDNLPSDSGQLLDVAQDLIESVNGLGRLLNPGFEHIRLTGAFTTNGDVTIALPTALVASSQLTATATVLGPDGVPVPQPPPAATRYLRLAATNPRVAQLLKIMGQDEGLTWENLYQVDEIIKDTGDLKTAMRTAGMSEADRSRFKHTANYEARHAQTTRRKPPTNPMELATARAMMRQLATAWLDSL